MKTSQVPQSIQTLGELFLWRCHQVPQGLAYGFVRDNLDQSQQLTYEELAQRVERCARTLGQHAAPGERALLLCAPGLDVVVAFWACMRAGLVPVPAPPPDPLRLKNSLPQLRAIFRDAQTSLVLASGQNDTVREELLTLVEGKTHQWLTIDQSAQDRNPGGETEESVAPGVVSAQAVAYLQYTSGSTSSPRGVMITHQNILAQCEGIRRRSVIGADARSLCWLPYFHDYGLVHGIVGPFYAGIPAFLMSPMTFLRRPLRWLEAMQRCQITHSGAPNFAYELCARAVEKQPEWTGDLHRWTVASCGAEPIHAGTLDRFYRSFSRHGFRRQTFMPAYGLAESTLVVTTASLEEEPKILPVSVSALGQNRVAPPSVAGNDARLLVGCGTPLPHSSVTIVDPVTGEKCLPDCVGEIWVAGPSVAQGYWNKPELSGEYFGRPIAAGSTGEYLRTGDLGFVREGQLFITGRLKDLIILNGRNLYPNDIESAIEGCHPLLRKGASAAFSVEGPESERLVIVQELERAQQVPEDEIALAIRVALAERCEVPIWAVVLVKTGAIPKTSSGKVQRQACRNAYLAEQLPVIAIDLAGSTQGTIEASVELTNKGEVELRFFQIISEQANIPLNRISGEMPLVALGLDSFGVSQIKYRVEEELGAELTFAQLFSQHTISDLVSTIISRSGASEGESRRGETDSPFSEVEDQTSYPLSLSQERLWFLEQIQPGSALNHITLPLHLEGPLDKAALARAFDTIVQRHAMLRMGFESAEGEVRQRLSSDARIVIRESSLKNLPPAIVEEECRRWVREEALVPFDLSRPPLVRVLLLEKGDRNHVCVLTVHRLVADGWSLRVLCKEVTALYNSSEKDARPWSSQSEPIYADYAAWQRAWVDSGGSRSRLAYWTEQLKDLPAPVEIPADRPRPHVSQFHGGARSRVLTKSVSDSCGRLCTSHSVTKFMVLYAAFSAWLHQCGRTDDIVVGSVVANRPGTCWNELIGYAVNPVALRLKLTGSLTGDELLARAREVVSGAYDHQDVPFERVLGSLNREQRAASSQVFNIMFVWEDDPSTELRFRDLAARRLPMEDTAVEFDLTLLAVNGSEAVELIMLYDRALFDAESVDRMLEQLETILEGMAASPSAKVRDLPLLTSHERDRLLGNWNETAAELPIAGTIPDVVDKVLLQHLDRLAVICGETQITYRALVDQSSALARAICRRTHGRHTRVALNVERSAAGLVGIMGILKAGCAYVPLDPTAPEQRQRLILDDAEIGLVVTQRHLRSDLPFQSRDVIDLDSLSGTDSDQTDHTSLPAIHPDHVAYVIYTSGSSGKPKGVEVTHRSLLSSLGARLLFYRDPVQRCLLTFPFAFDGSITGIFWTWLHAGTLVIPTEDQARDPQQMAALVLRHRLSHMVLVPSLYDAMLQEVPQTWLEPLRVVITAGESLPVGVVHRHHERIEQATLYNEYGPTEGTVWAAVYRTNGTEQGARVPIGKPIANSSLYVLDHDMRPVPVGMVGEICIGGAGVAKGYLNQAEETARKFVPNPYQPGTVLYRTGDLGVWRRDGNVEFIGRSDHQVKIRGYRIELEDIEAALKTLPGVRDAAVVVRDEVGRGPVLVAFVTSLEAPPSRSPHLLELLKRKIPSYMVPADVIVVDALPMLASGKLDRQALRVREWGSEEGQAASLLPRDSIEQNLAEIWASVLGRPATDIHQNFFALGGHSLLATQIVSRIREVFRIELPLRSLFETPTIAGVAEQIRLEQRRSHQRKPLPPIVPVPRTGALPLSHSQQRMWFVQQLAPSATAYNLLFVSRQKGPLNVPVLRQVVDLLSRRHESFRTTFAMTEAGLVQRVAPWQSPHLVEIDLRTLPKEGREEAAKRLAEEEGGRPFDLERGPLARIALITLDHDDHILVLNLHHIVADQWSFGILGRDFATYYNALCQKLPIPDLPLPIQYADYAVWQRQCLTDDRLEDRREYWSKTLENLPLLYLPTDYPRPATQTFRGSYCSIEFPESLLRELKDYSLKHHVTTFMTMLACFHLLLSRYSGQEDVAVGSPIANRTQMAAEHLIGTFVNTLVLRTNLSGDPSFDELVGRVKEAALGAFANQDYPFDRLVDQLQVDRDPSMGPLVQVLFNMVNAPIGDIQLWGLKWEPFEVDPGSAQFDLSLTVEVEFSKKAYLTFNTDLFKKETAQRILTHFVTLLRNVLASPAARLSSISMLTRAEQFRMLEEWNRTSTEYPWSHCIPELVAGQAAQSPEAVAVGMNGKTITYRRLNEEANRVARLLQEYGVGQNVVVGVCLDRSPEMIAVLLAVMKTGGTYLPLDPEYPRDRIRYMIEDSGASVVVTISPFTDRVGGQSCRRLYLDLEADKIAAQTSHDLSPIAQPDGLAYLLYTSGSTGQPKGVEIRHRSLVNFLWSMKREPGCTSGDVLLAVTTLSFDIAGLELYLPLISGGRVELADRATAMDAGKLRQTLEHVKPTIMQATPATWRMLVESGWNGDPGLTALCGGEGLPQDLASTLVERTKALWNLYGPTETTIWSTVERIDKPHTGISIGKPIANTEIYILDAHRQPVPVGVAGEIYIGGHGLARGYHRRPDLTADRFVPHRFSNDLDARLYRTGDLARYREDGRIVHLGRIDHQVKIRGFRIELGEIEAVLGRHPKLSQAVVTAREDQLGLKQLVAYVVSAETSRPESDELRSFLRALLPDYMVPAFFVYLDQLPLTANKKVDVRALPPPEVGLHSETVPRVSPRDVIEVQLTALWQQVLGIQDISIHDNFFDLGGHSLKAAQLFFQLELVYGRQLPLATLFQAPTIAGLAAILTQENWTPPWQSLVAIQPAGSAPPLFMVPGVGGNVLVFAKLAKLLGSAQPVYGLQARGLDGKEAPFTSVTEMATHYVQQLKRVSPKGPYRIAGVCTGGLIAYEMAQQLQAQGEAVVLFMMDTWHPDSYARYRYPLFGRVFMAAIVLGKIWADLALILHGRMGEWWPTLKRKARVLASLLSQSATDYIRDQDFQIQRLTQATLVAVARYRVKRFSGKLVNVVASRRAIDEQIPDTRHRWEDLVGEGSCTVHVPAEDSGRLFVSPHVEEVASLMVQRFSVDEDSRSESSQRTPHAGIA